MQIMEDYSLLVAGLEYKVRQLIEINNSLHAELQEKKEEIQSLATENQLIKGEIQDVSRKKQMLELAGSVEEAKDPKKLKLKINEYLREIDRCIAYFNSQ